MRGEGGAVLVEHLVGIAVVGGEQRRAAHLQNLVGYAFYALVNDVHGFNRRRNNARVAHHVAVCKVQNHHVELARFELLNHLVGYEVCAHLGLQIVGRNLGRGDKVAHLPGVGGLNAAVEEEGYVRVFLGLGNSELFFAEGRKVFAKRIFERGFGEGNFNALELRVVNGKAYVNGRKEARLSLKSRALGYDKLLLRNGADALEESYNDGVTDEFIKPTKVYENGKPIGLIEKGDSVICFNFRPDRAREITRAVSQREFVVPKGTAFERKTGFLEPVYVCFTVYDAQFEGVEIAFPKTTLKNTLGEYLASLGKKQLRIAETEKYAHVTFFFNGGVEAPNKNEVRDLIPSPKVATYDLQPEMSAYLVTDKVIEELETGEFDVVILNFANCDMVGHTGVIPAAVKAVHVVDECVKRVLDKILEMGGSALLTADHGNADKLLDEEGKPFTAHTTNRVPVVLVSNEYKNAKLREDGILADLAPTLLTVMGVPVPAEMTGKSLIAK